jgi:hypothetical protein
MSAPYTLSLSIHMARSAVVLLALFVAALFAERALAQQRDLPFAWVHACVLAAGVTLSLGSIQGVVAAWRQRSPTEANPSAWRDGEQVQVEGRIRLRDRATHAPFSGRPAAYVEYGAWTPRHAADVSVSQSAHWRGFMAMPAELETAAGRVALVGMPPAKYWSEQQYTDTAYHAPAAQHLVTTSWTPAPDVNALDLGAAWSAFDGSDGGTNGPWQRHVMSHEAAEALGLRDGAPSTADVLRQRLGERGWTFTERIVPPDARVTVIGTYRTSPPRLEVGASIRHPEQAVHLGTAVAHAQQQWRGTLIFAVVLAALTVAAHALVYGPGSAWYRGLLASAS